MIGTCIGTSVALGAGLDEVVGLIVGTGTLSGLGFRLINNSGVSDGIGDGGRVGLFGNVEVGSLAFVGCSILVSTVFSNPWSGFNSTVEHPRPVISSMTLTKPFRVVTIDEFRIMPSILMLGAGNAL